MLMTRGEAIVRSPLGIAGWLLGPGSPGAGPHSSMSRICLGYGASRSEIVLVIHRNYRTHQHSILSAIINFCAGPRPSIGNARFPIARRRLMIPPMWTFAANEQPRG